MVIGEHAGDLENYEPIGNIVAGINYNYNELSSRFDNMVTNAWVIEKLGL